MLNNFIHPLVFPVPPKIPLPRGRRDQDGFRQELHEVSTKNGYRVPLVYYRAPREREGAKRQGAKRPEGRQQQAKRDLHDYVLVFSHGNADDISHCAPLLEDLSRILDISVIGYEYIGYNHTRQILDSDGWSDCCSKTGGEETVKGSRIIRDHEITPSESGCYESIDAAHEYIRNHLKYPEHRQIWMGCSIGSGPTIDLVSRLDREGRGVAGMVLVSPFYSATSVVSSILSCFYDLFPNYYKMPSIRSPTLILHGSEDEIVPADHSERLAGHYVGPGLRREVILGAEHNDMFDFEETLDHLRAFIKECRTNGRRS